MDNIIMIFILVLMNVLNNVLLFINDRKYIYWYIGYI